MFRCCINCSKRYVGCHARCRSYQVTKKAHEAENHAKQLENLGENHSWAYQHTHYKRNSG